MYYLIKLLRKVLMKFPLGIALMIGNLLGVIFYLNGKKRKTAFKNIKMSFPEKNSSQIRKIMRQSFRNLGFSVIEMLIAPRIFSRVEIIGKENIIKEEGGIITGIHEGNYELFNAVFTQTFPLAVLARKQKNNRLDRFLNDLREEYNIKVYFSLKNLIRCLKNNHMIGVIADHGAEDNARIVEFFSHLVPTPGGAVYLAKKFDKKIYPCFDRRVKGFSHIGEIKEPINPAGKSEEEILREINQLYENELKKYPSEYIWSYKRFKRKRNLDVIVLSDAKTGHLKQSLAFLSFLKEESYTVRSKTIEIKYTHTLARNLSEICACFAGKSCLGCGCCLKFILNKQTLNDLEKSYADIVVSTGSSVATINKLFSAFIGAKSAVILRPNIPLRKFDLAIIPEHDRIYAKEITKIKGALVYPENAQLKAQKCKDFFHLNSDKKVSLFIGGPVNEKKEFINNFEIFVSKLKSFLQNERYKLLVSTSRRTPKETENFIEKELGNCQNIETIVYPRKDNYDFIFEGFISLSEIVFVTSESISMVSEILSSKKPCVCLFLENQSEKHNVFLQSIKDEANFLEKPYNIKDINHLHISAIFEQNRTVIKTAIKKIL